MTLRSGRQKIAPGIMRDDLDFRLANVPPARDPWWVDVTLPLLGFFREGSKTVDEVVAWGKERDHTGSMIRHMLAYLSFMNQVHYDADLRIWSIGPSPVETDQEVTPSASDDGAGESDD